jgi:hypothetical protein
MDRCEGSGAPIFVLGTPRSGTTLTAKILGRHSALFMPGETHFFEDIYNRRTELGPASSPAVLARLRTLYGRYNEPADQARIELLSRDTPFESELGMAASSYECLFKSFMDLQMGAAGKRRWGNNTPRDLFEIDRVLQIFPDAKIIACVRDVRDFLVSYRDNWRGQPEEEAIRIRALYHPVVTSLLWRISMRQLTAALRQHNGRILLSRYEDLVQSPEASVAHWCRFIGEPFEPEMLDVTTHNSSTLSGGPGIFSSSAGRWINDLSADEAYIAELIAGPYLQRFGYRRVSQRSSTHVVVRAFMTTPLAFYRGLHANRYKRGPLVQYLARRIGALLRRRGIA